MENTIKLLDTPSLLSDIMQLGEQDFYIEVDLTQIPSIRQTIAMTSRWRAISEIIKKPLRVHALVSDISMGEVLHHMLVSDNIFLSVGGVRN